MRNTNKNRYKQQKKKQNLLLASVVGGAIVLSVILLMNADKKKNYDGTFHESDQSDTITYGGKEYRYNEHLSNFLFLGVDTREKVSEYETGEETGRADAVFLLVYDRMERSLQTILIPRDTMTQIEVLNPLGDSLGLSEDHINLQYAMGDGKHTSCRLMKDAVSRLLFDIPIQGYCSMNMDGIVPLTDALGGVTVTVPDDSLAQVNPEFQAGAQVVIDGANVENFVRYRDTDVSQSAMVRMNRQKVFLQEYTKKAREMAAQDQSLITHLYESVQDYLVSNIDVEYFARLLSASSGDAAIITIPGDGIAGEIYDEYHVDDDQLYEMVIQIFYKEVQE
ncbi:MAG: LCP family protein [Eubacterium sp.]|nr:LCP family protein [Eubacterium sp.]